MYLLPEHKIAFSANPRTASRAIGQAIVAAGGAKVVGHHAEIEVPTDWRRFCVIRPHWEVLASFPYADNGGDRQANFTAFLRSWLYQHVDCEDETVLVHKGDLGNELFYRRRGCDVVLRYSSDIGHHAEELLDRWGLEIEVGEVGRTGGGEAWRTYFTPESWVMLEKSFGPEMLALFGNDDEWPVL